MMQVYTRLYKGTGTVDDVNGCRWFKEIRDLFYAHLYLGLYYEAAAQPQSPRENTSRRPPI
jgi:hypothetical protein